MTDKKKGVVVAKKDDVKAESATRKKPGSSHSSTKGVLMILTMVIIAFGITIYFYMKKQKLPSNIPADISNKSKPELGPSGSSNSKSEDPSLSASYNLGPEPPILSFAPDLSFIMDDSDSEENLSPYDQEAEKDTQAENTLQKDETILPNENPINSLSDYRIYVASANELIFKFLTEQNYSDQLEAIMTLKLPDPVEEVVLLMEQYLTLKKDEGTSIVVFPVGNKILEKFIKISKTTPEFYKQLELEHKIKENLYILKAYIDSPELQKYFVNKTYLSN